MSVQASKQQGPAKELEALKAKLDKLNRAFLLNPFFGTLPFCTCTLFCSGSTSIIVSLNSPVMMGSNRDSCCVIYGVLP